MSSASVPDLRRARPRPRPRPARRWSRATACHTTCHRHTQTVPTVSAEPPPSALNMTLPAFGAERRRRLLHGASCFRSISPARLALSSKPAGCSCYCRSMGQTDRRTDRRQRGTARFAAARRTAETGFVKLPHRLVDVSQSSGKYTR